MLHGYNIARSTYNIVAATRQNCFMCCRPVYKVRTVIGGRLNVGVLGRNDEIHSAVKHYVTTEWKQDQFTYISNSSLYTALMKLLPPPAVLFASSHCNGIATGTCTVQTVCFRRVVSTDRIWCCSNERRHITNDCIISGSSHLLWTRNQCCVPDRVLTYQLSRTERRAQFSISSNVLASDSHKPSHLDISCSLRHS